MSVKEVINLSFFELQLIVVILLYRQLVIDSVLLSGQELFECHHRWLSGSLRSVGIPVSQLRDNMSQSSIVLLKGFTQTCADSD